MNRLIAFSTAVLVSLSAMSFADNLTVDPAHSFVVFEVSHLDAGHVIGRFNSPAGAVDLRDGGAVEVTVKASNLDTGIPARDEHLKKPDFFDANQFPEITFKSDSIKKSGEKEYDVSGSLSMHGTSKPMTVKISELGAGDKGGQFGYRAGYEATFTVKRSDFGMNNMLNMVGDEVKLTVALECKK